VGQPKEAITLTALHSSTAKFVARLRCPDGDPIHGFQVTDMKITAFKVGQLSNVAG
jgi:hypothetical protein